MFLLCCYCLSVCLTECDGLIVQVTDTFRPTVGDCGALWPTLADSGRLWPPLADHCRLWPSLADWGRLWPTVADAVFLLFCYCL